MRGNQNKKGAAAVRRLDEGRTLEELGVPAELARELEGALRALGEVEGGRLRRRAFVTPDGKRHAVRVGEVAAAGSE